MEDRGKTNPAFVTTLSFRQEGLISGPGNVPSEYGAVETKINVTGAGFDDSTEKAQAGSTLSVHGINYEVKIKTRPCCGSVTRKVVLSDVDAIFHRGMNAVLGPTGSGKSSLLDVLAGRKDPTGLTGTLLLDGVPPPDNFKCMVGYVVQDDVVMGTLTIRENLQFSAALRLSKHITRSERNRRVDQVIDELGLTRVADVKVGTEFIRGVSGGERKRTNIGMELIISPPVLFLDEPTTGLDANTANSVMLMLKRLADRGRTIIFSIHQPRYSIYRLFDQVVLLSQGEIVYHGKSLEALDYFQSIGYECEEHNNPPDFFLDVINGAVDVVESFRGKPESKESLIYHFRNSQWHNRLKEDSDQIYKTYADMASRGEVIRMAAVKYKTHFLRQFSVVAGRTAKNLLRNPQTSFMQFTVIIIFALIVGAIYFDLETTGETAITNRVGAFFFIIMNQVFGNLSAVELFIKERGIFRHENVGGFYRVSSYFFSKVACDVIPMRLAPVILFSSISYWMIGFQQDVIKFLIYALFLFLTTLAASGVAFFISSSVGIFAIGNLLIALSFVFMMVFGGLLININSIAAWLSWLKYFSIFRYALNALSINELKDQTYCELANSTICDGNLYLDLQNIAYRTNWDLWQNAVALISMTFILLGLTYVQLLRMKKLR